MSQTGLSEFDASVHKANVWFKDLMHLMNWQDRHRAYGALRAVLHCLRDHLPLEQVAALGAQLPMLVRGFYYEGWHPAGKPLKERKRSAFLESVAEQLEDPNVEPEKVVTAVFQVLNAHLSLGEVESAMHCLPKELRALWPSPSKSGAYR
jgi:uncharacterized protein (DUF2267 family)